MTTRSHVHRARAGQISLGIIATSTVQSRIIGKQSQEDRRGGLCPLVICRIISLLKGLGLLKKLMRQGSRRIGAAVGIGVGEVYTWARNQLCVRIYVNAVITYPATPR